MGELGREVVKIGVHDYELIFFNLFAAADKISSWYFERHYNKQLHYL